MGGIDLFIEYYKLRTDGDEKYAQFMYLQAYGLALGKKSYCNMIPYPEQHNLYVLLVGDSFYGRKGVSQELGMKLYPFDNILPNEFSPEQFIECLSKSPKGVLALGEFSKILKMCKSGKGYMAPIIEIWNDLYRYQRTSYIRETKSGGFIEVKEPYLAINATCTEEVLQKYTDSEMLTGGFFGRFILVPGVTIKEPRRPLDDTVITIEKFFSQLFLELNKFFAEHPVTFEFTKEAFELYNRIEDELYQETKVTAIAGRYGQAVAVIADILAFDSIIMDNMNIIKISDIMNIMEKQSTTVTGLCVPKIHNINNIQKISVLQEYVQRAYALIKPCIDKARDLKDYCESEPNVSKLRQFVKKHRFCKRSDFMRQTNTSAERTNKAENTLSNENEHGTGEINIIKVVRKTSRGGFTKPMIFYCWNETKNCSKCIISDDCHYKLVEEVVI